MDDLLRPRLLARRVIDWWAALAGPPDPARPAAPVDELVARLGLEVTPFHPATRRGGTLGWLEPGEDLIFLREDLPEPVRRFTLAHELGHALLHRAPAPGSPLAALQDAPSDPRAAGAEEEPETGPDASCDRVDLEAPLDPLGVGDEALRPGQAYSARARRESEANVFAAALLLPADLLRALYLGAEGEPALGPRALADRFVVSEGVVHQALATLLVAAPDEPPAAPGRPGGPASRPVLDPWQHAAAAAKAPALVVAGPGTGKTSTLVGRVAHLVFERRVEPVRILALTFSNRAAQEMRGRVAALLSDGPAGADARRPLVSTIHAFCGDLLRRYGPLVGLRPDYRLISEAEGYLLLREVCAPLGLAHYQPLAAPAMHFPALLAAISRAKDELTDPERYVLLGARMAERAGSPEERAAASRALEVARVYRAYQDALDAAGNADFGDLIRLTVRLLREQPEVRDDLRQRHAHVLVDEFQDINHAMGVLLQELAGPDGQIWAVGDADQAIYRFRGASPANLARFTDAYPDARIHSLGANYRSRPPILRAAAAVAGAFLGEGERAVLEAAYRPPGEADEPDSQRGNGGHRGSLSTDPPPLADRPPSPPLAHRSGRGEGGEGPPVDPVILLAEAPDEEAELVGLAAAIHARVARGQALADQAILCRTRRQCQRVAAALDAAGLTARVVTPLLDQAEIKDILAVLLLLADGSGAGLLRAGAIADHGFTRAEGCAVLREAHARHMAPAGLLLDDARALAEVEDVAPAGLAGLARLGDILTDLWAAPDVAIGLARYIFALTGLGRRTLADPSPAGALRAANLARLLALARAFEDMRRATAPAAAWPVGGARWDEFADYIRVLVALGREPGAAPDELLASVGGVRVLTVHASKGLEFPVVYLPGLGDGRFPTQRRGEPTPPPDGLSADEALAQRDGATHLGEEACLFYVAITRARDALVLSRAERYGRRRYAASPFLRPIAAAAAVPGSGVARATWPRAEALVQPSAPDARPPGADSPLPAPSGPTLPAPSGPPLPAGEGPGVRSPEPVLPADEALRSSAIETYQRCPRQFAYRYVYRLRPREVGLGTLRRSLHDTLRDLQGRCAPTEAGVPPAEVPTLAEARALFAAHWRAAVAAEAGGRRDAARADDGAEQDAPAADGPFGPLYRRHGLRVVERAWSDLLRERGLPLPADVDAPPAASAAGRPEPGPDVTSPAAAAAAGAHPAPVPLGARLDEHILVRVGARTIEVTLDRVEGPRPDGAATRHAAARPPAAADVEAGPPSGDARPVPAPDPVRFVRHRFGRGAGAADLRALLYALAAEQERGAPAQLFQHNLTTGELEPVRLEPRRLARLRQDLVEALAGMESGAYPPRPDPIMCAACPFLLVCPA